jgi:glycosyltransferase involved in cell wall biosynthesis
MNHLPWVSFCISTYKRPEFLRKQIELLLQQTFKDFEIIISDNDPDASGKEVVESFPDRRIKYFTNTNNLGMIRSFNKSIDRALTNYIVMVTDDDPIEKEFLSDFFELYKKYPGYSIYCGFLRKHAEPEQVEVIDGNCFINEILDPDKTYSLLWSSCIMKREDVLHIGKIPDYGSPHLADHALIVMTGSREGGVVMNRMYSSLTLHNSNFSKSNFDNYTKGCEGFYTTLSNFCKGSSHYDKSIKAVIKHLNKWFISSFFNLKKYYTVKKYNPTTLREINEYAEAILNLFFMKSIFLKYKLKNIMFQIKKKAGILQ